MFDTVLTGALDLRTFFICIGGALAMGMLNAGVFMFRNRYSAGFVTTLTLLSPLVAVVIMLVNGNVGAGVAVAGTFSMIRFRSAPGTAQEICSIFLSVVVGIACGMGTMYELRYTVVLKDRRRTKAMIDAIRCRNGNLPVSCGTHRIEEAKL